MRCPILARPFLLIAAVPFWLAERRRWRRLAQLNTPMRVLRVRP